MTDQTDTMDRPEDDTEDDYALRNRVVASAIQAAEDGDRARLVQVFEPLHPADIADLLEQVNAEDRTQILRLAADSTAG